MKCWKVMQFCCAASSSVTDCRKPIMLRKVHDHETDTVEGFANWYFAFKTSSSESSSWSSRRVHRWLESLVSSPKEIQVLASFPNPNNFLSNTRTAPESFQLFAIHRWSRYPLKRSTYTSCGVCVSRIVCGHIFHEITNLWKIIIPEQLV